jgi:RND family efflux transporter MFP subunit
MKAFSSLFFCTSMSAIALFTGTFQLKAATHEGLVQPLREVIVSSQVESLIVELAVREGDFVEQGEVMARLYSRPEELEVERARAALEMREFENQGAQNLFKDNLISEDEAMQKRIELNIARIVLEQAEEAVSRRVIMAPISGIVVDRFQEEGELVTSGDPLFELVDVATVRVQLFLSVEETRSLQVGQSLPVIFPELGSNWSTNASVEFIDPRVDPASGLMRVRLEMPNKDGILKAGLRGRLTLNSSN